MPPRTAANQNGATGVPRYELPVLDLKFGSLTEGTDIPPPQPSPIQEEAPKLPTVKEVDTDAKDAVNGHVADAENATSASAGVKRAAEGVPGSPTQSHRGSLRRLLSRSALNEASVNPQNISRPPSRTASVMTEDKKARRGSGWFRRLRANDVPTDRRMSSQFEDVKKPMGPPPPMIPELSALESKVDTNIGDDLFKDIK